MRSDRLFREIEGMTDGKRPTERSRTYRHTIRAKGRFLSGNEKRKIIRNGDVICIGSINKQNINDVDFKMMKDAPKNVFAIISDRC